MTDTPYTDKYTTPTPRTDASEPQLHSNVGGWVRADFARELERELNSSQAEVKRLKAQLTLCLTPDKTDQ
jgi:hypothetical protein